MGFQQINKILKDVKSTEYGDIVFQKLQQLWFT
jgi:hypothetical protein